MFRCPNFNLQVQYEDKNLPSNYFLCLINVCALPFASPHFCQKALRQMSTHTEQKSKSKTSLHALKKVWVWNALYSVLSNDEWMLLARRGSLKKGWEYSSMLSYFQNKSLWFGDCDSSRISDVFLFISKDYLELNKDLKCLNFYFKIHSYYILGFHYDNCSMKSMLCQSLKWKVHWFPYQNTA